MWAMATLNFTFCAHLNPPHTWTNWSSLTHNHTFHLCTLHSQQIYDPNVSHYEVPMPTPAVEAKAESPLYDVTMAQPSKTFTFDVTRAATKTVLLVYVCVCFNGRGQRCTCVGQHCVTSFHHTSIFLKRTHKEVITHSCSFVLMVMQ